MDLGNPTTFFLLLLLGALPGFVFVTWFFLKDEVEPWWKTTLVLAVIVVPIIPIGWFGNLVGVMAGLGYLWEWLTERSAPDDRVPRPTSGHQGGPAAETPPKHQAPTITNEGPVEARLHRNHYGTRRFESVAEAVRWAEGYLELDRYAEFTIRDEENRTYFLSRREGLRAGPGGLGAVPWKVGDPYPNEAIEARWRQIVAHQPDTGPQSRR